jgi:hypothetical protein
MSSLSFTGGAINRSSRNTSIIDFAHIDFDVAELLSSSSSRASANAVSAKPEDAALTPSD